MRFLVVGLVFVAACNGVNNLVRGASGTDGAPCGSTHVAVSPYNQGQPWRTTSVVEAHRINYVLSFQHSLGCTYHASDSTSYDFSALTLSSGAYVSHEGGYTMQFNICAACSPCGGNVASCQDVTYSCGTAPGTFSDATPPSSGAVISYTGGSSAGCVFGPRSTAVTLLCDPTATTPIISSTGEYPPCHYTITLQSVHACPLASSTPSPTATESLTESAYSSHSFSRSSSKSASGSPSSTASSSQTPTISVSSSQTPSQTPTISITATVSASLIPAPSPNLHYRASDGSVYDFSPLELINDCYSMASSEVSYWVFYFNIGGPTYIDGCHDTWGVCETGFYSDILSVGDLPGTFSDQNPPSGGAILTYTGGSSYVCGYATSSTISLVCNPSANTPIISSLGFNSACNFAIQFESKYACPVPSGSPSGTHSVTSTRTPSTTPTVSVTESMTSATSATTTRSASATTTSTESRTLSPSASSSPSVTRSMTSTASATTTPSGSAITTPSRSGTTTPSRSPTTSGSTTRTLSPSASSSQSVTLSTTITPAPSASDSASQAPYSQSSSPSESESSTISTTPSNLPLVTFSFGPDDIGAGSYTDITVTLSAPDYSNAITLFFNPAGTAVRNTDYTFSTGNKPHITILPGRLSATLEINCITSKPSVYLTMYVDLALSRVEVAPADQSHRFTLSAIAPSSTPSASESFTASSSETASSSRSASETPSHSETKSHSLSRSRSVSRSVSAVSRSRTPTVSVTPTAT